VFDDGEFNAEAAQAHRRPVPLDFWFPVGDGCVHWKPFKDMQKFQTFRAIR